MDVDKVLEDIGGYRRWHLVIFVLLSLSAFLPVCQQMLGIIFIGWEPPYHCNVPHDISLNESLPFEGKSLSKCRMFVNRSVDNKTTECMDGFYFYNDGYETIVTEFDLVCQNDYLSDFSQFIYVCISSIGGLFSSYLIDRFGRKKVHIISHVLVAVTGSSVSLSPNYISFLLLRSLCGVMTQLCLSSGMTLLMEHFGAKHRTVIMTAFQLFWVATYLIPELFAYFIKDWRINQLVGSSISLIWIIYIWFLTESVPWLVVNKRYDEAERVLRKMARRNNVKLDSVVMTEMVEAPGLIGRENDGKPSNNGPEVCLVAKLQNNDGTLAHKHVTSVPLRDLFCDPKLRLHLIMCNLFWLANTLVFYGLNLVSPSLGPDRFLNYFLMGIIELPAYICCIFIVKRYGRKYPMMIMFLLTGVFLGIAAFIPEVTESGIDLSPLKITLALVGKFAVTSSFAIQILYTLELFPTNLRSSSLAWGSLGAIVGASCAPLASYLARHSYWITCTMFAVSAIVAGLATLALPETKDKPLAQNTEEIYEYFYGEKKRNQTSYCINTTSDKS